MGPVGPVVGACGIFTMLGNGVVAIRGLGSKGEVVVYPWILGTSYTDCHSTSAVQRATQVIR